MLLATHRYGHTSAESLLLQGTKARTFMFGAIPHEWPVALRAWHLFVLYGVLRFCCGLPDQSSYYATCHLIWKCDRGRVNKLHTSPNQHLCHSSLINDGTRRVAPRIESVDNCFDGQVRFQWAWNLQRPLYRMVVVNLISSCLVQWLKGQDG